jgi:hypothetical protein
MVDYRHCKQMRKFLFFEWHSDWVMHVLAEAFVGN